LFPAGRPNIRAHFLKLSTGVSLRVVESGPIHGRPVIMLHGWGASAYMYRHALELLPARGIRAIAVDLRGYGLSDKPTDRGSYALDSYCADVDALLDVLELPAANLIGQSMGGGVALHYALRNPARVERLVLVNPVGLVSIAYLHSLQVLPRAVVAALGHRLVPRYLVEFILRHVAYGDPTKPTVHDVDEYWAPTQLSGFVNAARSALSEFDWRPISVGDVESLSVRTAVLLGTKDRLIRNAARPASRLRDAVVHSVRGGHCVLEENPAEVYEIVGKFLTGG
jgi:pimeloyl-ACP methyl ester carboxylesterase